MYQFYYADKNSRYERLEIKSDIRNEFQITDIRPAMWEEHCLECSAPLCFETCAHYKARSDGRCKRFENGMSIFEEKNACCGQGVHVKFRMWGNMMTIIFPAMMSEKAYSSLWKRNEKLGRLLKLIEKSKLPVGIRWQAIRIVEYVRRMYLRRLRGSDNNADAFLFHGYSYIDKSFRLVLEVYNESTSVYKTSMNIQPGENCIVVNNLSPECSVAGNLVKIYPENNTEAELDIFWCDFVKGKPIASSKPAEKVKCVVWDLDGTLWNEILIETENAADIKLKDGIREVIEELDSRGIIQSVASKNDPDAAMGVLRTLGIADYFIYPQIHWNAKSGSIESIAKSLNIGIDALAFVDDNVFERQQVSFALPQVRTYDAADFMMLTSLPEFDVPVTEESRNRRKMYKAEEARNLMMQTNKSDAVDFLRFCNIKARIFTPETEEERLRCYELVIRTNQLNMSGIKYTSEEFSQVLARDNCKNFAFDCKDDFGEYGIVGFGQYYVADGVVVFTEFAMSCRVARKYVESAVFASILNSENASSGAFNVQKTKKNILLRNSLEEIGFVPRQDDQDAVSYVYNKELLNADIVEIL